MPIQDETKGANGITTKKGMPTEEELLTKLKTYLSMKFFTTKSLWTKYKVIMQDKDYKVERDTLKEIIIEDSVIPQAFIVGTIVAVSTFVLCSRIPRIGMALGQQSSRTQGWYILDIPPGEERSFKLFSVTTNILLFLPVSVIMGGFVAQDIVQDYQNHELVAEKLSKVPLVPGRSIVAEEFCRTLTQATTKILECQLKPFKSKELRHYMTFAHNCEARRLYLEIAREELDDSVSTQPLLVSQSGVPYLEEEEFTLWSEQVVSDQGTAGSES